MKWCWIDECQKAFKEIKEMFKSELMLLHFDPKLRIIVASDASESAIGAVILHNVENCNIKPIARVSYGLQSAGKKLQPHRERGTSHYLCSEEIS